MKFSASLACADYLNLERDINCLIQGGIKDLHLDIMDGHYVPNLCLNLDIIKSIKQKFPSIKMDVHLMVTDLVQYLDPLAAIGVNTIIFHLDTIKFGYRIIDAIKDKNIRVGIAINPSQILMLLNPFIDLVDMILLMSVEPGFAGQKFMPFTYQRIKTLSRIKKDKSLDFLINIDGGINLEIAKRCSKYGANCAVLGLFSIFNQPEGIQKAARKFIDAF